MKDKELREIVYDLAIWLDKKERERYNKSLGIDAQGVFNSRSLMNRVKRLKECHCKF